MSKRRILLADDSLTIQKVVNLTFADEGIEVVAVGDGDAAMEKFIEATPDLVMADVHMPGLDGYRLCEMIKQDEETRRIPVILLVGSFEPFDEKEARRVGADDFIIKPFQSIRQLVNKVFALLDAKTDGENSLYPLENAPVSSFADALKTMPSDEFDLADDSIENLGDAGMDDEMIQTTQIGSLPVEEIHKYESQPIYESFAEDIDPASIEQPPDSESLTDELEDKDWSKTQPLTEADFEEIANVLSWEKTALPSTFDNSDLLEFPHTVKTGIPFETVSAADSEISKEAAELKRSRADEISELATHTSAVLPPSGNLSPESIEAIANRVVEKLSNKVIKRVVTEVLSQMERKR